MFGLDESGVWAPNPCGRLSELDGSDGAVDLKLRTLSAAGVSRFFVGKRPSPTSRSNRRTRGLGGSPGWTPGPTDPVGPFVGC